MGKIRIIIADDHPAFLEGLQTVLTLRDAEIEVVGSAANGQEAVALVETLHPEVALLDIKMAGMDGVEAAKVLRDRFPEVSTIMLTTFDDLDLITAALRSGAKGYLLKEATISLIIQAIHTASEGGVLLSQDAIEKLTRQNRGPGKTFDPPLAKKGTTAAKATSLTLFSARNDPHFGNTLSEREGEILHLIALGKSNQEIGQELFISEKTVRNHITHIYDKLGVNSRTKAVIWAMCHLGINGGA